MRIEPRLLADIGGTNARFALETAPRRFEHRHTMPCRDHATLADAVRAYLDFAGNPPVSHAAIAIANPVTGDRVSMTNHHWTFSIEEMRRELGWQTLLLLNDFTAQALAVAQLDTSALVQIGGTSPPVGDAPKAVLGAGTGLGMSGLIPDGRGGYIPLAGEGGHASFAPVDDTEAAIWQYARCRYGHVSSERLISGMGLELIYDALRQDAAGSTPKTAADITGEAVRGDELCRRALDVFCAALGTAAADLALTLGARGGVYLCGGIVPRFIPYFKTSPFRRRFEDKGRFSAYLAEIPVYIVQSESPGISGAAAALADKLRI
ncbi:MAG: glucokinase [Neisseria sp.]|nr:glucokinase [Neisseria sp.]